MRAANRPPRPAERTERFVPDLPERAAPQAKERAEARRNEPLPERGIRSDGKERPDAKGKPDAKAPDKAADGEAAARKASPEAGRPQGEASGNAEADASGTPVDTAALVALQMETTGETPPAAGAVAVEAAAMAPALAALANDQPEPEGNGETGADPAAAATVPVALPVPPVAAVPAEGEGETADDETSEEVSADAPSAPVADALPDIRLQPAAPVAAPENAAADTTSTDGETDVAISSGAGQRRGEGQPGPSPVALAAIEGSQGRAPEALAKAGPPQGETRPGETPKPQAQAATGGPDLSALETRAEPAPTAQAYQPSSPFDLRPAPLVGPQGLEAGARVGQGGHNQPLPLPAQNPAGQPFVQAGLGAVPIEIGMKAMAGVNRFQIRLDPPELGRVEVKLEVSDAGEVRASLVVDKVETLALLQRDAKTLERAFEQVGLKPSDQGIDLSLRDQSQRQGQNQPQDGERQGRRPEPRNDDAYGRTAEIAADNLPPARLWRGTAGGVDLRI